MISPAHIVIPPQIGAGRSRIGNETRITSASTEAAAAETRRMVRWWGVLHAGRSALGLVATRTSCGLSDEASADRTQARSAHKTGSPRGTKGSNPSPSSGESANHRFLSGGHSPPYLKRPRLIATEVFGTRSRNRSGGPSRRVRPARRPSTFVTSASPVTRRPTGVAARWRTLTAVPTALSPGSR